jgi:hypothetical protein
MWYDELERQSNPKIRSAEVSFEEIESRYPAIYPRYAAWACKPDISLEEHNFQLGEPIQRSADDHVIAWELEGFLMACWLVLQPDVAVVDVQFAGHCCLMKDNLGDAFVTFVIGLADLGEKMDLDEDPPVGKGKGKMKAVEVPQQATNAEEYDDENDDDEYDPMNAGIKIL